MQIDPGEHENSIRIEIQRQINIYIGKILDFFLCSKIS